MSDNIQEKQQYLRDEILNIGYDPSHFASYLINEREDGDDIDNWSLESLIDVVKSYKMDNPDPESISKTNLPSYIDSDEEAITDTQSKTEEISQHEEVQEKNYSVPSEDLNID
jgi:hypothetical protein